MLEKELLKQQKNLEQTSQKEIKSTMVIVGLSSLATLNATKDGISNTMWELGGPWAGDTYCKGEYKGISFVKFAIKNKFEVALRLLKKAH